jgi:hypothetical protein
LRKLGDSPFSHLGAKQTLVHKSQNGSAVLKTCVTEASAIGKTLWLIGTWRVTEGHGTLVALTCTPGAERKHLAHRQQVGVLHADQMLELEG